MGRRKKHNFNKESSFGEYGDMMASIFGFAIDGIKIIFKLKPDEDQTTYDFIFEKIGAVALLVICLAILIGVVTVAYFHLLSESHYY